MSATRAIAITIICAGLVVDPASTAWADTTMDGHYIETEPKADLSNDWYFTPCGDGCASVASSPVGSGQPPLNSGQARLVDGQWTLDQPVASILCSGGRVIPNAASAHYTWDANTLAGTVQKTLEVQGCSNPAGYQYSANIQLRQAP